MKESADKLKGRDEADEGALIERLIVGGDLSQMSPAQRVAYYKRVCDSLGLNPLTRPFQYIMLQGRLTLYATADAAKQLARRDGVSIVLTRAERVDDVYVVRARGTTREGRTDEASGAVPIQGLKGDALANALMKAETKAKRRLTLSICGLGWTDETELETISDVHRVQVDHETGEIVGEPTPFTAEALKEKEEAERREVNVVLDLAVAVFGKGSLAAQRFFSWAVATLRAPMPEPEERSSAFVRRWTPEQRAQAVELLTLRLTEPRGREGDSVENANEEEQRTDERGSVGPA